MVLKLASLAVIAGAAFTLSATPSWAQLVRPAGGVFVFTLPDRPAVNLRGPARAQAAQEVGGRTPAEIPVGMQNKKQALLTRAGPREQGAQVVECDTSTLDIAPEGSALVMGDMMFINNAKRACPAVGKTFKAPPGIAQSYARR